jgi:hypothetical protein
MGSSKIPAIIYYDQQGNVHAVSVEAICDGIEEEAEDETGSKQNGMPSRSFHVCHIPIVFMHL